MIHCSTRLTADSAALLSRGLRTRGNDGGPVAIDEALVLLVHERDARGVRAGGCRGGVVGRPHARHAAELLERVHLAVPPRLPLHVAEALHPEPVGERQRHDQHVDLRLGSRQSVRLEGRVASPIYVALGSSLVGEVPGDIHPLGLVGELTREHLVRVRQLLLGLRSLAVLYPEELHRELAVLLLTLDQRCHVLLEVRVVRLSLLFREEQVVDHVGVHLTHRVERRAALADGLGSRRHVALADVQRRRDVRLAGTSLCQHHEIFLVPRHRHLALFRHGIPNWTHATEFYARSTRYQGRLRAVPAQLIGGSRIC